MIRLALPLVYLLLGSPELLGQGPSTAADWRRAVASLPDDPTAAAALLAGVYRQRGIPLTYWLKRDIADTLRADPPDLELFEHPCGPTAFVQAPAIPVADQRLEGEYAVELDLRGRELQRWPLPVDHFPLGLSGDRLIINLHAGGRHDLALAVAPNGDYWVQPFPWPRMNVVPCPPYAGFGDSVYVRCVQVVDEEGTHRLIAYQGPCT